MLWFVKPKPKKKEVPWPDSDSGEENDDLQSWDNFKVITVIVFNLYISISIKYISMYTTCWMYNSYCQLLAPLLTIVYNIYIIHSICQCIFVYFSFSPSVCLSPISISLCYGQLFLFMIYRAIGQKMQV